MSFLTIFLSPFNLLFFIVISGFLIGKIRIRGISLGIAGILFASIFIGVLMNLLISDTNTDLFSTAKSTMKIFSNLGTYLFVSVIGLQAGFSLKNNSNESIVAFLIGSLMSISGVLTMFLIASLDRSIGFPTLLGILCGALTSTPGLSSVCELIGDNSKDAVWGYGCSYLLGVILVVAFTEQLTHNKNENKTERLQEKKIISKIYPELILVFFSALFGSIIGNVQIPFINISIGSTASTLLFGLLFGYIIKRTTISNQISLQTLNTIKNLGLVLFLAGTGYTTGLQSVNFEMKMIIYGALITLTAIFCGWLLCKGLHTRFHNSFIIAGGMTSSPAYGAISSKASESSVICFSFSYFGSLLSLMISLQFIGR